MPETYDDEGILRSVALQNAQSIHLARQRAEEDLRKQTELLRITLASIGDAVISTDVAGRVTFLNGVAQSLTGWTQADAAGQHLPKVFHIVNEHTRRPTENPALRALRDGMVVGLANHTILIARDGAERPIDDSAAPIRDAAGNPVGAVLVFRDVTERKQAERAEAERTRLAALRADVAEVLASGHSLEDVVQRSAEALVQHLDAAFARVWILDEAAGMLVLRASAGLYTHLDGPHGRIRVGEYKIGRIAQSRHPHLTNAVCDDPNVSDPAWAKREGMVAFAGYPLSIEGRVVGVMAMFSRHALTEAVLVDLAPLADAVAQCIERKRGEHALRESEERQRTLADNLPSGFMYQTVREADGSRRFTHVSAGVEALCGVTPSEALADPVSLYGLIVEEDRPRVQAAEDAALRDRNRFDCQFRVRARDGQLRWLHCRSAPRDLSAGSALWDGIAVEITERMEMEEALREADRRKDVFIAVLAHELRNPLAPIRNGLKVIELAGDDLDAIDEARAMMDRQLGHMVRLIDDLLDVSRISQSKMELRRARVLLSEIVGNAVETARPVVEAAGHELTVTLPTSPITLDADLTRLAQVFSNLLTNSAKYMGKMGRIWLSAEPSGDDVVLCVRDTGIGIPAESLPRIFDMFSQVDRSLERSTGGLGIGLALVKGLVEMHGGTVVAASDGPGKGSTFTVRLPSLRAIPDAVPAAPHRDERRRSGPGRRILVVDDSRDSARTLAKVLRLLGHEVTTAYDGIEAIEAAETFRPDVILMDMGMPRLNGYDAARLIRGQPWGRDATIIALTGWGQEGDRIQSKEAGCDGHLVKPVNLPDLENILAELPRRAKVAPT